MKRLTKEERERIEDSLDELGGSAVGVSIVGEFDVILMGRYTSDILREMANRLDVLKTIYC